MVEVVDTPMVMRWEMVEEGFFNSLSLNVEQLTTGPLDALHETPHAFAFPAVGDPSSLALVRV